ncbi:lipopolysaccharide biosynthesis protein [Ornithinimicrobium sufpigmenti]|uniref:lipopolysaccharide biosynthesis protein n=1 Tax=Ornithinimicrobium sufpigmenti TaxID=2508882 RepID=UPI0010363D00|nr:MULTISPECIES: hypothetical protein [unclassified Ornithinimicrobium]
MTRSPSTTSVRAEAEKPRRGRLNALGGVGAQGTQAIVSLALQVIAARVLGAEGLGLFAAVYALIVMATAVSSGFVGDSLTVLDRADRRVRAALQGYWVGLSGGLGLVLGLGVWTVGLVDGRTAVACAFATAFFLCNDVVRRTLMATMRFWHIVIVDLAVFSVSISWIVGVHATGNAVDLAQLFLAMACGQAAGIVVGVAVLPRSERHLVSWSGADWGVVARYGAWRALQQLVRPTMLAGVRVGVIAIVSLAAAGELEAARIYMAPAMVVVGGVSSFLFASYAAEPRETSHRAQLRRVDRNVGLLVAFVVILCLLAILGMPWLAPLLTDGEYELSAVAVVGWAVFAAAVAMSTPYGQMAAVRGHHVSVFAIRCVDALTSLTALLVLLHLGMSVSFAPLVLAVGSVAAGMMMRWVLVRKDASRRGVSAAVR